MMMYKFDEDGTTASAPGSAKLSPSGEGGRSCEARPAKPVNAGKPGIFATKGDAPIR